jgi:hypothetical protein
MLFISILKISEFHWSLSILPEGADSAGSEPEPGRFPTVHGSHNREEIPGIPALFPGRQYNTGRGKQCKKYLMA